MRIDKIMTQIRISTIPNVMAIIPRVVDLLDNAMPPKMMANGPRMMFKMNIPTNPQTIPMIPYVSPDCLSGSVGYPYG
jgi:hypothetical protein